MLMDKQNDRNRSHFHLRLSVIRCCFLFIIILFSFIITHTLSKFAYNIRERDLLTLYSSWRRLDEQSFMYNGIAMPCIEPHCDSGCSVTYESDQKDGIIRSTSLGKMQYQHLMIDTGRDTIVQKLISSISPPKTCPYREKSIVSSNRSTNITVKFYPILFGFADQFLPKTISRKALIDNQLITVDQICLPKKTNDFSELIPGQHKTYKFGFENELDYRRSYSTAYFAITMKKGGWDCNRHYEIISSGTMPFFDKLDKAGNHTLSILPKSLLYEAQAIPGVNRHHLSIDHKLFDINRYNLLLHRLLYYAKHRLTTVKIVEYILTVIKYSLRSSQKHSVLYISHDKCDYMKDFMLHGFTHIFEENLHVFQPPRYMYQYPRSKMWTAEATTNYFGQKLYGFGYGYKLILKNYVHLYERDKKDLASLAIVQNNIKARNYSLIVFGSILRENNLFTLATEHYEQSEIVLIDGEDDQKHVDRSDYSKRATYFLREIPDDCDVFM
jgi:hypothetical protein